MIASLTGRVLQRGPDHVVLQVGGVGLLVQASPSLLADLREDTEATLATSLVVREDALTLFGFTDDDTRSVFELLQGVSGVGPKLAHAIVSVHEPDALRRIVATDDLAALTQVPGVGRKGAQRLVLELKDRLGAPRSAPAVVDLRQSTTPAWGDQIATALLGLGWTTKDADAAVSAVSDSLSADQPVPDTASLLRLALRALDTR